MSASTADTFTYSTIETIMSNRKYRGCIGVFWDVVDFPFPDGSSPASIYHNLKVFVQSLPCPAELISVMVYADKSTFSDELVDDFKKAGITIFSRQADEYTRYRAMSLDIAWWEADVSLYRTFRRKVVLVISREVQRESLFSTFFKSMASLCKPIYFTPAHDPPTTRTSYLEPISFILPSEPIPQSVTEDEESLDHSDETEPDSPIESKQGDRYRRVHKMSTDIALWAMENPATYFEPRTLMVISKNMEQGTDFRNTLEALDNRHYNVLLGQPVDELIRVEWLSNDVLPKHRREEAAGFSHRVASLHVPNFYLCDTLIIWDVLGCPTDFFPSVFPVLGKKDYHDRVSIRPYADVDDVVSVDDLLKKRSEWFKCEPIIRVSSKVDKYAKVTRMLLDIMFWAMNNDDAPQNLLLISKSFEDGTTACDTVMKALERRGFNVIFRPCDKISSVDESTVEIFESLCENPPDGRQTLVTIKQNLDLFQGRILTNKSRKLSKYPVVLFWLAGKRPPSDPRKIWSIFESAMEKKGYNDIERFTRVYIDEGNEMIKEYQKAHIHPIIIPEKDACGEFHQMLLDMVTKTRNFISPANFVVISEPFEDPMCDLVVQGMKLRNFNVLFELPEYLLTFGSSSLWSAKNIL
ncbi:unnamed protein product [Microthlaspi erraticum]|uniref:NYN domain-containing protein n=1 Tax=Microthlaspi erraticum TaxID=1685480 RepID=A0A6D2HLG1_9BRAS|nr:unnamed protein product [Microthlaspi erraticum]